MNQQFPAQTPQDSELAAPDDRSIIADVGAGNSLGKYVVTRRLGQGGMGVVYEAVDPLLERSVAIKVLRVQDYSPEMLERLLQEARAIARLNHPHVVAIHSIDRHETGYYLVMELVAGGSVWDRLATGKRIPWREATRMVIGACKGLLAAHAAGLIHRDIKPGNILLTPEGDGKLADFGLAKGTHPGDRSLTNTGNIVGTPDFMSPEQCRGEKLDDRSDFYSLGATYYALLTGLPPFHEAGEALQIMYAHCTRVVPDPRRIQPDIPANCVSLLQRMLAKEPAQRPNNAAALLKVLESLLDDGSGQLTAPMRRSPPFSGGRVGVTALSFVAAVLVGLSLRPGLELPRDRERPSVPTNSPSISPPAPAMPVIDKARSVPDLLPENPLAAEGAVEGIAFSLDDSQLAWVTADRNSLTNMNLRSGKRFEIPFTNRVHCVAFDATGRILACGDATDQLRRWDTSTGTPLPALTCSQGAVGSISFSRDGTLMAAGLLTWQPQVAALHVWSLVDGVRPLDWPLIVGETPSVAFSSDSAMLASASRDGTVRLWDVATRKLRKSFNLTPEVPVSLAFSADGRYLATALAGENRGARLWDLKLGSSEPLTLDGPFKDVGVIAFTPDSRAVVCGGADGVWFWNVTTGQLCGNPLPNPPHSMICGMAFSHDGSLLVIGTHGNVLQVWHQSHWPNHRGRRE